MTNSERDIVERLRALGPRDASEAADYIEHLHCHRDTLSRQVQELREALVRVLSLVPKEMATAREMAMGMVAGQTLEALSSIDKPSGGEAEKLMGDYRQRTVITDMKIEPTPSGDVVHFYYENVPLDTPQVAGAGCDPSVEEGTP